MEEIATKEHKERKEEGHKKRMSVKVSSAEMDAINEALKDTKKGISLEDLHQQLKKERLKNWRE